MHNVLVADYRAARTEALYSAYSTAIRLGGLPVTWALPQGVTVDVVPTFEVCGCRSDECFFCGAELDAMEVASWEDEQAELDERYGTGWYVAESGGKAFTCPCGEPYCGA